MAAVPERARRDAARPRDSLALVGLLSVALVLFYTVLYPIRGIRVPAWSDAQTYIWWARRAGALGLSASGTGTRPATIALLSTLATIAHVPAEAAVEVIGPILGAAAGLATAAFTESALGLHRRRFVLVAILAGTFLALLVTSFYATLAFAALFVAGLACASEGLGGRRAGPMVATGVLFGVAALAHPAFGALGAVLVLCGLATVAVRPRKSPSGDGRGPMPSDRPAARLALGISLGAVIFALGLVLARSAPGPPLDTAADAVLRRLGLGSLLRKEFRDTFFFYLPIVAPTVGVAALAFAVSWRRRWPSSPVRLRLYWGVVVMWLAVTTGAIALMLLGLEVPGQRLAALCLPLPLLIAIGLEGAVEERGRGRAHVAVLVALLGGVAFLVPRYWVGWEAQRKNSGSVVSDARIVGSILGRQPAGTPLVLVADERRTGPSFQATRFANYLRDSVPPERVPDVHVFVGRVQDFLAGRPTLTGDVEHDRMGVDYWNRIDEVLDRPALGVVFRSFDPADYRAVLAMPGHLAITPGVVAIPGFTGAAGSGPAPSAFTSAGAGPLSPWLPVWLGPLLFVVLAAAGWPWVAATVPGAGTRVGAAVAPAFGIAAISLTSIVADALGLRLDGWGAVAAFIVALGAGWGALAGSRRAPPKTVPGDHIAPHVSRALPH